MHRRCLWLATLISLITLPVPTLAEPPANPASVARQIRPLAPVANEAGFYVLLPAVDSGRLIERISAQRASVAAREQDVRRYLEEHQLGTKDILITVIMPGGLLYAATRKGRLERAETELADIGTLLDELSRDLVNMQAVAGDLSVAQLR